MKTKLLICGKSSSGKDTLTNHLCEQLGLKQLISCATRPMRYEGENTHVFMSPEIARTIIETEDILAYTKIGDYEYFSTYEQFMASDIYIIDPKGIEYLKDNYEQRLLSEGIQLVTIYIYASDETRLSRAMLRNDDIRIYNQRCIDEYNQFNKFQDDMIFDYSVCNEDAKKAQDDILSYVYDIIVKE